MSTEPLPELPFVVDQLKATLDWIREHAREWREKYPNLPEPPYEVTEQAIPKLVEAVGDPLYAARLLTKAWAGVMSNNAGYNKHHGGLAG